MKKKLLLLPLIALCMYVTLCSYSEGPAITGGVEGSGATGNAGCSCHNPSPSSGTIVSVQLYDATGTTLVTGGYVGGTTYKIKLTGSQANTALAAFGFQLAVVKAAGAGTGSAVNAGTLSAAPTGTHLYTLSGINIFEHYNAGAYAAVTATLSGGVENYSETITWKAPVAGTGSIVAYGTINAVNGDHSAGAPDAWNNTSLTIPEAVTVAAITGTTTVCVGAVTQLSDATAGGSWASSNTGVATVIVSGTGNGHVTGVSAGSATITYNTSSGFVITTVTVSPLPNAGSISGLASVCAGSIIHLTDATTGGSWSSTNTSFATVTATGDVTGVAAGSATISYSVTNGCGTVAATQLVTVNPLPIAGSISGLTSVCTSSIIHLTDATTGGNWSSTNTSFATVTGTGDVTGVAAGSATISYTVTNGCGTFAATQLVTVNPLPVAGSISGLTSVCTSSIIHLTDATTGGNWSSNNTSFATVTATGDVVGVAAGSATISYTVTNGCGTVAATQLVTVNPLPIAGSISGLTSVCTSSIIHLTDATTGGNWSSNNTSFATVTATGDVVGVAAGSATISYTVTNGCGTVAATQLVTVNPLPIAGSISGLTSVCTSSIIHLTDATTGGNWSSNNTSFATVTAAGDVTGVSAGSATISYTVTNSCGTVAASQLVTVNPLPNAGSISGLNSVCAGSIIHLTDATTGGSWSSTNTSFVTVTAAGDVTGVSAGSATISYTVTNSCGTVAVSQLVTVNPLPNAGSISGLTSVCAGSILHLTDATTGGSWSSANTSFATVTAAGDVTGVAAGSATISYTVTNGCGTAVATLPVTIDPLPLAGTIFGGSSTVCQGAITTFSDAITGGVWSSSNTSLATVSGGAAGGISAGSVDISYKVTNGCGIAVASVPLNIIALPLAGSITGGSSIICVGTQTTFSDATGGGTWSSSNTSVATVTSGGLVAGVAAGNATISYSITNSCATAVANQAISITLVASAGSITGASSVCPGNNINLSDPVTGGTWSSTNTSVATISATGVVTGSTSGTTTISYSVSGSCGVAATSTIVTVNSLPAVASINGLSAVCQAATITLSDVTAGGVWSSSNTSHGTVSVTGSVTGVSGGSTVISYTFTNSCGPATATYPVTINPLPSVAPIAGATEVCIGSSIQLSDATSSGTWSSSNTAVATVNASGNTWGAGSGSVTISYTVTNSCSTTSAAYTVTVAAPLSAGTINGLSSVCVGAAINLSDAVTGGAWSSSNTSFATVTSTGLVSGLSAGGATISYAVNNICGTVVTSVPVTINPLPLAGAITGLSATCVGSSIILSDAVAGGTWSSSNTSVATVSLSGNVGGLIAGSVNISYSLTNVCGTGVASVPIVVNPLPVAGTIAGGGSVCVGATVALSDAFTGGVWSSNNTAIATVTNAGSVGGVAAGSAVVSYSVNNTCGTVVATMTIAVNPLPFAGVITGGAGAICVGATAIFSDATTGGTWSTSNTSIATVIAGTVTGVAAGNLNVSYSMTNICGTAVVGVPIVVNPLPIGGTITGPSSVCVSGNVHLSDGVAGGTWSSSNTSLATISASGLLTGASPGSVIVSYTVTSTCGSALSTYSVTVNPLPFADTVTGLSSVCAGNTINLTDVVIGGNWSSSNNTLATVAGGVVSGIAAGSVTISYSVTNGCGTAVAISTIAINPLPVAGTITGMAFSVCSGAAIALSDAIAGGTWNSGNLSVATVSSTGVVHGLSAGTASISYTVTNGCGSTVTTASVSVNSLPATGIIAGSDSVCMGNTTMLSDALSGGVWSTSNTNAFVSSAGLLISLSPGLDTVYYTLTNGCGSTHAILIVRVLDISECTSIVKPVPGIEEDIDIYPNPSAGSFDIVIPRTTEHVFVSITDMSGRIIESKIFTDTNISKLHFDISKVASGSYVVKVITADKIYRKKIVIW